MALAVERGFCAEGVGFVVVSETVAIVRPLSFQVFFRVCIKKTKPKRQVERVSNSLTMLPEIALCENSLHWWSGTSGLPENGLVGRRADDILLEPGGKVSQERLLPGDAVGRGCRDGADKDHGALR